MKKRILFLLTLFLLTTIGFSQDFEVSPLKLLFNAEPGESQTKFVNVKNHNSTPETFILSVSDYTINSKGQGQYVEAGSMKYSIADWISIAPSFFELEPNEEKQIAVTIQQPTDNNCSKWGVIFVRTAKEQTNFSVDKGVSTGINISARIAIDVYQTPGTNKNYKATIGNMIEVTENIDTVRTFSVLVNNLEDVITNCKVYLIATNIKTAEESTFDAVSFVMFPKSSRKMILTLPSGLPKGTYSLAAILDYGSKTNLEGTQIIISVE
jgi:hypothetical protein